MDGYSSVVHLAATITFMVVGVVFAILAIVKSRSNNDAMKISNQVAFFTGGAITCIAVAGVLLGTYIVMQGIQ